MNKNKERVKAYVKKYVKTLNGILVSRVADSKQADKKHKRDWTPGTYVTKGDLLALWQRSQNCHYCKCVMQFEDGQKKDGATIERLDNTLAHTKENCVIACRSCNCGHVYTRFHPSAQLTVKS